MEWSSADDCLYEGAAKMTFQPDMPAEEECHSKAAAPAESLHSLAVQVSLIHTAEPQVSVLTSDNILGRRLPLAHTAQ